MSEDRVRLEVSDHVATLTLDRPEKLNAIDVAMDRRLNELVFDLNGDDDVRVVVLTGAGERAFCVGSDLGDLDGYGTSWQYRNRVDRHLDYALGFLTMLWGFYALSRLLTAALDGPLGAFGTQWLRTETTLALLAAALLLWRRRIGTYRGAPAPPAHRAV